MKNLLMVAVVVSSLLLPGCSREPANPSTPGAPPTAKGAGPGIVSAEKNSFQEVSAHLDPGGNFYMYWSSEQVVGGLSESIGALKKMAGSVPGFEDDRAEVQRVFAVLEHLAKSSGVEEVSGVGMSSIAREKGFYQSKVMLHHYKGKQSGFLWSMAGKAPHTQAGLEMLPATTAFAAFGDFEVAQVWSIVQREIEALGMPKVSQEMQEFSVDYEKSTGLKFDATLASLGGEYGMALTLNPERMNQFPTGNGAIEFPEPGLVLVVKVKNDLIFNRVAALVKENPMATMAEQDGVRMIVMPVPLPIPVPLRPTLAQSGEYLYLASSDELVKEMLAVKKGSKPGLKATAEFKKLAANVPDKGNNFMYISPRLGETIGRIQKAVVPPGGGDEATAAMAKFFGSGQAMSIFSVSQNTEEGWLTTANGTQSPASIFAGPAMVAPVGLLAAIAIPNFVKARTTAQKNACIANLKMLDGATQQWALEHKKRNSDKVVMVEILEYLRNKQLPVCPAGGTYHFTTVEGSPTCSQPGHALAP